MSISSNYIKNQNINNEMNRNNSKFDFSSPLLQRELEMTQGKYIEEQNKFMNDSDWENIFNELTQSKDIDSLILSGININNEGLEKLCNIIENFPQIKNLKLEWNYLNNYENSFSKLIDKIINSNIEFLGLSNNKINSSLCIYLQKLIKNSRKIKFLDLRWNDIGNDGAKELISELGTNRKIIEINLMGNKLDGKTLKETNDFLIKNCQFNNYLYTPDKVNYKNEEEKNYDKDTLIPLGLIEKEKYFSREIKARYDAQLIENSKLTKENKEIEKLIEIEKNRLEEMKKMFEISTEKEKENRQQAEDTLISIKEELNKYKSKNELIKEEIRLKKKEDENEIKLLNANIESIQDEINRKEKEFNEKYSLLNNEYKKLNNELNNNIVKIVDENEKINKELQNKNEEDYDELLKQLKNLENENVELQMINSNLQSAINKNKKLLFEQKLNLEEEFNERENKFIIDEENNFLVEKDKLDYQLKNLRKTNEDLLKKNNNLNDNIKIEIDLDEENNENKLNDLKKENDNLKMKNISLNSENLKLNTQIKIKENLINKNNNKLKELDVIQELNEKNTNDKLSQKNKDFQKIKNNFENEKNKLNERIRELENEIDNYKIKNLKIDENKLRIAEQIKKSINNFISNK